MLGFETLGEVTLGEIKAIFAEAAVVVEPVPGANGGKRKRGGNRLKPYEGPRRRTLEEIVRESSPPEPEPAREPERTPERVPEVAREPEINLAAKAVAETILELERVRETVLAAERAETLRLEAEAVEAKRIEDERIAAELAETERLIEEANQKRLYRNRLLMALLLAA